MQYGLPLSCAVAQNSRNSWFERSLHALQLWSEGAAQVKAARARRSARLQETHVSSYSRSQTLVPPWAERERSRTKKALIIWLICSSQWTDLLASRYVWVCFWGEEQPSILGEQVFCVKEECSTIFRLWLPHCFTLVEHKQYPSYKFVL